MNDVVKTLYALLFKRNGITTFFSGGFAIEPSIAYDSVANSLIGLYSKEIWLVLGAGCKHCLNCDLCDEVIAMMISA